METKTTKKIKEKKSWSFENNKSDKPLAKLTKIKKKRYKLLILIAKQGVYKS